MLVSLPVGFKPQKYGWFLFQNHSVVDCTHPVCVMGLYFEMSNKSNFSRDLHGSSLKLDFRSKSDEQLLMFQSWLYSPNRPWQNDLKVPKMMGYTFYQPLRLKKWMFWSVSERFKDLAVSADIRGTDNKRISEMLSVMLLWVHDNYKKYLDVFKNISKVPGEGTTFFSIDKDGTLYDYFFVVCWGMKQNNKGKLTTPQSICNLKQQLGTIWIICKNRKFE